MTAKAPCMLTKFGFALLALSHGIAWAAEQESTCGASESAQCVAVKGTGLLQKSWTNTAEDLDSESESEFELELGKGGNNPEPEPATGNGNSNSIMTNGPGCHCSFVFVDASRTWTEAQADCVSIGMALAVPKKNKVNKEVMRACQQKSCWIGGKIPEHSDGENIEWVNGNTNSFKLWDRGEPNGIGGGDVCIQMYGMKSTRWKGRWNDVDCSGTNAYVCEKTDPSCCVNTVE